MEIICLVRQFCEYAQYIKGNSPATIRRFQTSLQTFCSKMGLSDIAQVSDSAVHQFFLIGRRDSQWRAATFLTYRNSLMVFFRWCVKHGHMTHNPIDDIDKPPLEKSLPKRLSKKDALRVLEYIDNYPWGSQFLRHRNHAIFAVFIFTGLRRKELINLKFADVDLVGMTITVRHGKGAKDRLVPICPPLARVLERYVVERKRLRRSCPEFFASLGGNVGFTDNGLKHLLDQVVAISKIKFGFHRLRHTFATLMIEGGCDLYSLSKMMGHADIKTTTIYLSATAEHLRGAMMKHPMIMI